jgi:hypothetical protein
MNDLQHSTQLSEPELRFYHTAYRDGYDAALDAQHRYVWTVGFVALVIGMYLGSLFH